MADTAEIARRVTDKLRLPPHSVEAEQALLGGLMLDQRAWDQVADVITADDLYRADHRIIFTTIGTLVERNQPPDAVTVSEHLERTGQLEAAGGLAYLARLVEDTPSAANIRAYARIVRERAMLRQLIQIGGDIAASAHATEGLSVDEIVDRAEQLVFEIADGGAKRGQGFVPLKQILPATIDRLDMLSHSTSDITGIPSGFADMDKMTAGLQRGDLIIVAGRPSMGKCVVAGSRVLDPDTGALRTIDACVSERRAKLVALDAQGRLAPAHASDFVDDGVKPVYELTTALGRRIAVTASHPFLTPAGWQRLAELGPGMHVAVPRVLPFFGRKALPDAVVKLAAYFVAGAPRPRLAARLEDLLATARTSLHALGRIAGAAAAARVSKHGAAGPRALALAHAAAAGSTATAGSTAACAAARVLPGAPSLRGSAGGSDKPPGPIAAPREAASDIRVPDVVFELRREQLALFLNRAFACGGRVDVDGDGAAISYATASEGLARDMQHLLLRFGVVAELRKPPIRDRDRDRDGDRDGDRDRDRGRRRAFELRVARPEGVARFVAEIGAFGKQRQALEALRAFASRRGDDAATDIYWDRIESIEPLGERQVYDLTVPEHHTFVAEDVVVHNTTLAVNMAENAAIGGGVPTAIFSMEMSAEQLSFRMIGSIGRVNQSRLRTGKLSDEDWSRIDSAVSMMSNAPIFIDDSPALTPTEVRARARRLKREHGLGLIVVDYLQLMRVAGTTENRATEISEISRSLKALAKELSCPVIALSQLNRSVEQRTDKKPVMSDLRESGAIEQDADLIVFIYREEVYEPDTPRKGIADIIIAKQRNGPVGEFHLTFLGEFTKFENLVAEAYGEGVF